MTRNRLLSSILAAIVGAGLAGTAIPVQAHAARSPQSAATPKKSKKARPKALLRLDLNTAGKIELLSLPGIDETSAQKIIDGRPYKQKHDLVAKKILPEASYRKIKDRVIATASK